jgi:ligand-binding sensor domain-containing protein
MKVFIFLSIIFFFSDIFAREHASLGEFIKYDTSNSQIPKTGIYTISIEDSGKVWAGSRGGGLGIFDGTSWKIYSTQNTGLPSNRILKITFDHKNTAWIGTDSGLVRFDGKTWTTYTPLNSPMKMFFVYAIAVDKKNDIWFSDGNCCDGGLMRLSGNEWKLFTPENSLLPGSIINDIHIDSTSVIWVATDQGLARIEEDSWTKYDRSNSIMPHNWVDELCLDREGKIWVGEFAAAYLTDTLEGALMNLTLDGKNWSLNNPSQTGKASRRITAIACDKRGYLWVSTSPDHEFDYAVSIFNKKQWLTFALSKDDTSRPYYIPSIAVDKNNNIWFATDPGITMLKQDTSAIDALFAQNSVKHEFKRIIRKQKREMLYHDVLGRKSSKIGDDVKKAKGVLIGSDNIQMKKIVTVK